MSQQIDEFDKDGRWKRSSITTDIKPPEYHSEQAKYHRNMALQTLGEARKKHWKEYQKHLKAHFEAGSGEDE
jgi:hypothetical protein